VGGCSGAPKPEAPPPRPPKQPEVSGGGSEERKVASRKARQDTQSPTSIRGELRRLGGLRFVSVTHLAERLPDRLSEEDFQKEKLPPLKPGLWAAIDQHPPRRPEGNGIGFVELLNEDEELAPGGHQLAVYAVTQDVVSIQLHPFLVSGAEPSESTPSCLLWTPRLTYNGAQQLSEFSMLAIPLKSEITAVHFELEALDTKWRASLDVEPGQLVGANELPAGDLIIRAKCQDRTGETDVVERFVTINPESLFEEE
jgi:hypothetical protein